MSRRTQQLRRGQALIMVTLALIAMCGIMGLAVDLGWAFFVRRNAQKAADSAALAAAMQVLDSAGQTGSLVCGGSVGCQGITACSNNIASPPANNLDLGCLYAQRNGFSVGGNGGRQNVTIEGWVANVHTPGCAASSPPNCVPGAPWMVAAYWVTVHATETVPQLFSAILGNTTSVVSAVATAAVADTITEGSLILINRQNDVSPEAGTGRNLNGGGGPNVSAPSIMLASTCDGTCAGGIRAGELGGTGSVNAAFTLIRDAGTACAGNIPGCNGGSSWTALPQNGISDDTGYFFDPMRGKGQPPAPVGLEPKAVPGGAIGGSNDPNAPTLITPGSYYTEETICKAGVCNTAATGAPIRLGNGYFKFDNGGTFGSWVFFGGLQTTGGKSVLTFTPGSYFFAGQTGGATGELFKIDNGTIIKDLTPNGPAPLYEVQPTADAGEILVFTDASYPGLQVPEAVAPVQGILGFGQSGFKMGANDKSQITLHGLRKADSSINGTPLEPFAPVVIWQDQRNSNVAYELDADGYSTGYIDTTCGPLDSPCTNSPSLSRAMNLGAGTNIKLFGTVYQPRGAWVNLQGMGNSAYVGPLQIVAGALNLQGGPTLTLTGLSNPITRRVAALVQ